MRMKVTFVVWLLAAVVAGTLGAARAAAYERAAGQLEDAAPSPFALAADCQLQIYDLCSCWIWVYDDVQDAVWGTVFIPAEDCESECPSGGAVKEILLYTRCFSPPASIHGIRIQSVDETNCPTALLYESGPMDIQHCLAGDRWTAISVPLVHVGGQPFVVQVVWGPTGSLQLASENSFENSICWGIGFDCLCPKMTCEGWQPPPRRSFVYLTDEDGDGSLEDLCQLYGAPDPIAFPDDLPNNLLINVVMDCLQPTRTEGSSWGRVKSLYR